MNDAQQTIEARLAQIHKQIDTLRSEAFELSAKLAVLKCPIAPGDTIEYRYGRSRVNGVVLDILTPRYGDYLLKVQRIKKGGMLGALVEVSDYDKPMKVNVE